ncbi:hypothetical protein G9A89_009372 [Geosiphon pyriformis]|nr:hypothetical protein G9A89_009372 [Geosiphon pyriformis]
MSGFSVKKRSARVSTTGSVSGGSIQKVKKPFNSVKLSSVDKNLKDSGSVSVNRQYASMDMDGKASDGRATSNSQINTPNVKRFNTGAVVGFPLGSINYDMNDKEEVFLPFRLFFSLEKVWVDLKFVKSQVEVAVKKSFTLDINLSAMEEKSATKTQAIRKLFSTINGFGGATTSSKFKEII